MMRDSIPALASGSVRTIALAGEMYMHERMAGRPFFVTRISTSTFRKGDELIGTFIYTS